MSKFFSKIKKYLIKFFCYNYLCSYILLLCIKKTRLSPPSPGGAGRRPNPQQGIMTTSRAPPLPPAAGRPAPAVPNRPAPDQGRQPPMPPGRPGGQGLPPPLIPT